MSIVEKKQPRGIWITIALLCFFNANIGVIDILPDFIGSLIFVLTLKEAADLSPYFAEARAAFFKLGLCDLCKFFCQFSVFSRSNAVVQGDMSAMFSMTFLVLDTVFAFAAVRYLFEGLFYLGERSDAKALYAPFPLFSKSGPVLDPDRLKTCTLVFLACKHLLCTVPEFLRLSRDPADTSPDPARFYGQATLACFITITVFGLIWLFLCLRYKHAIFKEGRAHAALRDRLLPEELALYTDRVRRHTFRTAGYLFVVAMVLLLPLRLDSYGGLNIMPYFLFPFLLFLALHMIRPYVTEAKRWRFVALLTTLSSLASYVSQAVFFETYSFIDLMNNDKAVRLYTIHTAVHAADTVLVLLLLLAILRVVFAFIRTYTVCDEQSGSFTAIDRDYQKDARRYSTICIGVFIAAALARLTDVIQRGEVSVVFSNPESAFSYTTVVGLIPWFSTLSSLLTIFSVITAAFLFLRLRDAFRLRYPDPDKEN